VFNILFEDFFESIQIRGSHGLDDKALVTTEEEETATLALRFSRVRDCTQIA
jgi:hypothetical protein